MEEAELRARYEATVIGKRRGPAWQLVPIGLFEATGDPLVEQDPALAARVYGLVGAPRPAVLLRRLRAEAFGDPLSSVTDMAMWFQDARRWSALRSAAEAVALAGECGTWIGLRTPVPFERAVELVRKSVGRARAAGHLRYWARGWTCRDLFVRPAPGRRVPIPMSPARTYLPPEGAIVRDDAFWRRRLRGGDVLLGDLVGEDYPTVAEVMTAG